MPRVKDVLGYISAMFFGRSTGLWQEPGAWHLPSIKHVRALISSGFGESLLPRRLYSAASSKRGLRIDIAEAQVQIATPLTRNTAALEAAYGNARTTHARKQKGTAMPDNKPTLTASLLGERDSLLDERNALIRRMQELSSMLDLNASQIEATDTLLFRFDPNHAPAVFERNLLTSTRMIEPQKPLAISSAHGSEASVDFASSTEPLPNASSTVASTDISKKTKPTAKEANAKKASDPKAAAAASSREDEANSDNQKRKRERSAAEQSISDYFKASNRNETILQILRGMTEPVSAKTVSGHYRSLHPMASDTKEMRALHTSRVSAALAYLQKSGKATRIGIPKEDGRKGDNVVWTLSKSYRSDLKKSQSAGRPSKMNGQTPMAIQKTADATHVSGMTH